MASTSWTGWEGILATDEVILWQGRPDGQIAWRDLLSFESAFGLFFAGFATFWIAGAASITGGRTIGGGIAGVFSFFPLFGIPFLLVGLYLVVGRIFWDAFSRRHTWYTLTNQAAFIARDIFGRRSLKRNPIGDMSNIDLQDNTPGSVIFAQETRMRRHYSGTSNGMTRRPRTSTQIIPIGFRRIDDARHVYRILLDQTDAAPHT